MGMANKKMKKQNEIDREEIEKNTKAFLEKNGKIEKIKQGKTGIDYKPNYNNKAGSKKK